MVSRASVRTAAQSTSALQCFHLQRNASVFSALIPPLNETDVYGKQTKPPPPHAAAADMHGGDRICYAYVSPGATSSIFVLWRSGRSNLLSIHLMPLDTVSRRLRNRNRKRLQVNRRPCACFNCCFVDLFVPTHRADVIAGLKQ